MTKALVLLWGALQFGPASVQAQTIHGRLIEDSTRTAVVGALVELVAVDARVLATAYSDSAGSFLLRSDHSGNLVVRATHPSYVAVRSAALTIREGELLAVELRMGRAAVPLEPLVVTTRRDARLSGFYERLERPGGFGQFLTREQIKLRPGARTTDLLRGLRGVEIVPVSGSMFAPTTHLVTLRGGGGRCQPTIYVDGMVVKQFAESGIDSFLAPNSLEGVEIYTSPLGGPSPLHAEGACGVVAFWTRSDTEGGSRWSWLKLVGGVAGFALIVILVR